MSTKKKRFFLLLILLLVLAACSGDGRSPELSGAVLATEPAATVTAATEPAESSTPVQEEVPATLEPTPTEAQTVVEAEPETADPTPTEAAAETEAEEAPAVEAQYNGTYESTYFRGSATAPVTMIDYSDFL
jgi:ABC-type glycerol-3-phosphate transport system substrate-binding protein